MENKQVSPYQLAGASAFKAIKDYIAETKKANQHVVVNDESRKAVTNLVQQEVKEKKKNSLLCFLIFFLKKKGTANINSTSSLSPRTG